MTGYGQAGWEGEGRLLAVEIRSVNGRYFRLTSRLPHEFAASEHRFEKRIRERVTRGSVELYMKLELTGARAARPVNKEALASYLSQMRDVADTLGVPITVTPEALSTLPGVLDADEIGDEEAEATLGQMAKTLDAALDELERMRVAEGANLRADLLQCCGTIEQTVAQIEAGYPATLDQFRARLIERVNRLLADTRITVGEQDLAREIAIYADRSNVNEEIARVRSHVEQFREALDQGEPVGRRLEFLAQEMHREANTMSAKTADTELSRLLIVLLGEVDKIREQVLNVE